MFDFDFNSPFCVNAVGRQLHFFFLFSWGDVVLRLSSSLCVSPIQQLPAMDRRGVTRDYQTTRNHVNHAAAKDF
jgi:hypothetical protein